MLNPWHLSSQWLSRSQADLLLQQLLALSTEWQPETLRVYGKDYQTPRLVAFFGDTGVHYTYSKRLHLAKPWPDVLGPLCDRLVDAGHVFNCVLVNVYRDGRDYMSWHSDDEPSLGKNPTILSLSLGAERPFHLRHRQGLHKEELLLGHGSLLVMKDDCQHRWQHCLPRRLRVRSPRINLTFRYVKQASDQ